MALTRTHLLLGGLYLLTWLGLDLVAQQFSVAWDVTVWNPAVALDVVALLLLGLRSWPLLVLSRLGHQWLVLPLPLPPLSLLVSLITDVAGVTAIVWLLRERSFDPWLSRLRDVCLLIAVTAGTLLIVSALQVQNLVSVGLLPQRDTVLLSLQLWAGSVTGVGLLAPPLLLLAQRFPQLWTHLPPVRLPARSRREVTRRRAALETAGEGAVLGLALWAGYGGPRGASLEYSYALFVPLLWSAVRHGFTRTTLTVLALNVGVALLTGGGEVRQSGGLALQFGLLTVTLSGLLLGAVMRERRELTARLAYLARHDPLTGLGNRRLLQDRVTRELSQIAAGQAPEGSLGLLLLDFDHFKDINDTLGHSAGDEVLRAVGERLSAASHPAVTVARLGGDEFALVQPGLRGPEQALKWAERTLLALTPPLELPGTSLVLGASGGLALHAPEVLDADTLLRNADVALYHAKAHRRGQVQLFDAPMYGAVLDRVQLEADLRAAVAQFAFEVHYQPLIELRSGRLRGVEALVRWPHPTRGLLAPSAFIQLAEESGLIVALNRLVLRTAAGEVARWPLPESGVPLSLGVNLTATDLQSPDVVAEVSAALEAAGLAPSSLMLELTERVFMNDTPAVQDTLRRLRGLGVRLGLDDFGTGYSSLSYLRQFPISDLKVDRSFVAGAVSPQADLAGTDPGGSSAAAAEYRERSGALLRAISELARTLGLAVIAEGVETRAQLAQVRALGFELAQGYLISPPLPAAEARELAARRGPLIEVTALDAEPQNPS